VEENREKRLGMNIELKSGLPFGLSWAATIFWTDVKLLAEAKLVIN
jgi:hypothetical protein